MGGGGSPQEELFADFNGLPPGARTAEFYKHDANWSNRMILGDALQVMASLVDREKLRGKVQCIYVDPPYGIKFNSNFQWSTASRDVKDGNARHITREPEQVKAFRDTWRDGIHSYLTYLRDRLTVARDLLTESGSIFIQIGDENVHRVRAVMDEVFGEGNFVSQITSRVSSGTTKEGSIKRISDYVLWYGKNASSVKFRRLLQERAIETRMYSQVEEENGLRRPMTIKEKKDPSTLPPAARAFQKLPLHSMNSGDHEPRVCYGSTWRIPPMRSWRYSPRGFERLLVANRVHPDRTALRSVYYHDDYPAAELNNMWNDTGPEIVKSYVVQTSRRIVQRCVLMTTDPGDLVLDPTCGSGTTAYVAEQWGRRWITIDTSRVALALARARIMGARYPWYLLADSPEGKKKEAKITGKAPSERPTGNDVRKGFVYQRVPHITLKSIANNTEIDVIWERWQEKLEPLRVELNQVLGQSWEEWEIPRDPQQSWNIAASDLHAEWWQTKIARQKEIDRSIRAQADFEYLYDRPYENKKKVRVAGPFTVESLSPHRELCVDENDELVEPQKAVQSNSPPHRDFAEDIMETLKRAGVQQAAKNDKIDFDSLEAWSGDYVCFKGTYTEGEGDGGKVKTAGVMIGPEFGTVTRPDLAAAAREVAESGFDLLIACAFNYGAHCTGLNKVGGVRILRARMNADLHMASDLKDTKNGNLFVIFGEPDIDILDTGGDRIQVKIKGVDVYHPGTGEIRSDDAKNIACWFIDTDYNEENFFVRHAYFPGVGRDPYKQLKTTLQAEINPEAWETLYRETSRPFPRPTSGRIAVKVINHLGDEVMKVFKTD